MKQGLIEREFFLIHQAISQGVGWYTTWLSLSAWQNLEHLLRLVDF